MKWIKTSEQVPDRPDPVWIIVMDEDGKKVIYPNYSYDDLYRYAYPPIESPRKIFHYSYEELCNFEKDEVMYWIYESDIPMPDDNCFDIESTD